MGINGAPARVGSVGSVVLALVVSSAAFLVAPGPAAGEISKQERKEAQRLFAGSLFLRIDAPCTKGRHPYGIYYSPLVEVSPRGANTEAGSGASFGWFHAGSTSWSARVNDEMELEELDWEEDEATVQVELEGRGRAEGHDTVLLFTEIRSLADFQAAFDRAFSRVPLQDEHPDWSPEIRQAIADRRLLNGMSKRQAFYVVGMPARVAKANENGKEIETWTLQGQGLEIGFMSMRTGNPGAPPEAIQFENGLLVSADVATGGQLDLD